MSKVREKIIEITVYILFFAVSVGIMVGAYLYRDTWIFIVCGVVVIALWKLWDRK